MHTQEDKLLAEDVRRAIAAHVTSAGAAVVVTVDHGAVVLDGVVTTEAEHQKAVSVTRAVYGVQSLTDNLRVEDDDTQTIGEYVDDVLITASVKGKLLAEAGIKSLFINVETKDGVVTLTGEVKKPEQLPLAEHTAKMVDGVKKVDNRLVYKP